MMDLGSMINKTVKEQNCNMKIYKMPKIYKREVMVNFHRNMLDYGKMAKNMAKEDQNLKEIIIMMDLLSMANTKQEKAKQL